MKVEERVWIEEIIDSLIEVGNGVTDEELHAAADKLIAFRDAQPKGKTIGIVGSRRRDTDGDYVTVLNTFDSFYDEGDRIVSGGCPKGGDKFAERIAKARGLTITIHHPKWDELGRGAGFARNTTIAEDSDVLIACVAADRKGGTEDTVKKAMKLGKTVVLV
jgi:predicted Rossmann fold nucleotide-binding protein DprA/Smf involved in DNA uptake